jgi:putrescine transport system permease protein
MRAEAEAPQPGPANAWLRAGVILPYAWLLLFLVAPLLIILKISFADPIVAQPPFTPLFGPADGGLPRIQLTADNYLFVVTDRLYLYTYLNSLKLALVSTVLCLLIGYPMAYGIARARNGNRNLLLMLVVLPFWISFLLRVYAWMGLLSTRGVINSALLALGVIEEPLQLLYTNSAVFLGMVYSYLPFMILPLYATLERLDPTLLEAAADLGGRPGRVFLDVTLPLSMPGIIAGCLLVFIPAMGEYVIPALLGGPDALLIGRVLYDEFFSNRDWPVASAEAVMLLAILMVPILLFQYFETRREEGDS